MANLSKTTNDHEEIQKWAEERGGKPSHVKSTGSKEDIGILRIDFPGYSGQGSLEEITWEQFFEKFDERGLSLIYQEQTAAGERSNFNKLVSAATAEESGGKRSGRSGSKKTSAKKSSAKKSAAKTASSGRSSFAKKSAGGKKASGRGGASKSAGARKTAPAKKGAAKKGAAKKSAANKTAAKKTAAKKTAVKKGATKKRR